MNELELQTRIAKLCIRIEKAASKMPGRKRIPGDGDGDGIPNEGRKPKGGASGGIPAKPKLNNEGQAGKATQNTVLNNLDNAIRSGNVKAVNRGIKHARSAASNFALMGRNANNLTDKEKSALMETESIWRKIAAHGSAGLRHLTQFKQRNLEKEVQRLGKGRIVP